MFSKFLSVTYCTLLATTWVGLAQSTIAAQLNSRSHNDRALTAEIIEQTAQFDQPSARPGLPKRRIGGGSR